MAVTVVAIVSAEDEVGIVTVVGMAEAHMAAVTVMVEDMVVVEMVVVEGHTVVATEIAAAHLAVTTAREVPMAVVEMTEGHMAEAVVVATVTVVVAGIVEETHMVVVVMVEAEEVAVEVDHLAAVKMRCSLSQTRYLFKAFLIKSLNKSSLSTLVPLALSR